MISTQVEIRGIPYPYAAMLSICSDLDETPDRIAYLETMRFLNTTEMSPMGQGVGLEVGNSIYFDMPSGQFSYWNTDDAGREIIRTLIRSGHVDCLHSYGDLAARRGDAGEALDELARHGCQLNVWMDHSLAPTNFGTDVTRGYGDVPWHEAYHADLTIGHGIRYVWRGRVTSVIGQDTAARLGGLWNPRHPVASARTVGKEGTKRVLALCGSPKYAMHRPNRVLRKGSLRDGTAVYEFIRSNPHWGGVSSRGTALGIGQVLTPHMLDRLTRRNGVCILYTHLGKAANRRVVFDGDAVQGFRRLAQAYNDRAILVSTTHRLLRYLTVRDALRFRAELTGCRLVITLISVEDTVQGAYQPSPEDVQGITFVVPWAEGTEIRLSNGAPIRYKASQCGDKTFLTIPWERLTFPEF